MIVRLTTFTGQPMLVNLNQALYINPRLQGGLEIGFAAPGYQDNEPWLELYFKDDFEQLATFLSQLHGVPGPFPPK